MRELFKKRAYLAGFPYRLMSYHSLRAGFICSAVLKSRLTSADMRGVLEDTAYVANWVPNSVAQMRYVKDTVRRMIICNRMIRESNPGEERNFIEEEMTTSQRFHELESPLISRWDGEPKNYDATLGMLLWKVKADLGGNYADAHNKKICNKVHDIIYISEGRRLNLYFESTDVWRRQALMKAEGRLELIQKIRNEETNIYSILSRLDNELRTQYRAAIDSCRTLVPSSVRRPLVPNNSNPDSQPNPEHSQIRKRTRWTDAEDQILSRERNLGRRWCQISELLEGRTGSDCRDRLRNIQMTQSRTTGSRRREISAVEVESENEDFDFEDNPFEISASTPIQNNIIPEADDLELVEHIEGNIPDDTSDEIEFISQTENILLLNYTPARTNNTNRNRFSRTLTGRINWTMYEDMILVREVRNNQPWRLIAPLIANRTNIDCKDRWRTLIRHYGSRENIFRAVLG